MAGLFITLEGSDGSGKTTQIYLLEQYLTQIGYEVIVTREPGGTCISEKIRSIILDVDNREMADVTEALLYAASRAQHVEQLVKPALLSGKVVISDRFVDSSVVYQGIGRGLGIDQIEEINAYAIGKVKPDITFLMDLDPAVGIERKTNQTSLDRLEKEKLEFHYSVYEGYKKLQIRHPERIKRVDATKSKEEVHRQILGYLHILLQRGNEHEASYGDHS